ncbi:MAG: hypothetical protein KGZ92_04990 [Firmicutes bacterium]|nr:hypothetical protein [Dethiobacter sp.]MBS3888642.1 hypothetical protein [Bacillota bacterium]
MRVEPLKVTAVAVSPSSLTELGLEKGKEGVSFAQTLESVVGHLAKTAVAVEPEEPRETASAASLTYSPDYCLQMILQAELAAGGVNPLPAVPQTQAQATQAQDASAAIVEQATLTVVEPAKGESYVIDSFANPIEPWPREGARFIPPEWRRTASLPVDTILPPGLAPRPHTELSLPQVTPASVELPIASDVLLQPKVAEQANFSAVAKSETIPLPAEPTLSALHTGFAAQTGTPMLVAEQVPLARVEVQSAPEVSLHPKVAEQANLSAVAKSEPLPLPAAQVVVAPSNDSVAQPSAQVPVAEYVASAPVVPAPVVPAREGFRITRPALQTAPDTNISDLSGTNATTSAPTPPTPREVVAPAFVQRLNMEIISFAAHPTRPELTLEITPPEYGKVIVSAERERGGQVVVRLVAETPQAKMALIEQLPKSTPSLEVRVYTADEYREQHEAKHREQSRERQEQPERQGRREDRVEFKI